ncbi:hypothetical protein F5879DRAFT_257647 [Lentinula edodes]|nr:hypothetical protein F5879DRAFT_257647 [Lentinula edodes]
MGVQSIDLLFSVLLQVTSTSYTVHQILLWVFSPYSILTLTVWSSFQLYVKDFALRSRTALKGYIYTSRLPKDSHKTLATTILVAKGTNEDFVMGIPKAKLSQIGLRVWCAPRGCTKKVRLSGGMRSCQLSTDQKIFGCRLVSPRLVM